MRIILWISLFGLMTVFNIGTLLLALGLQPNEQSWINAPEHRLIWMLASFILTSSTFSSMNWALERK